MGGAVGRVVRVRRQKAALGEVFDELGSFRTDFPVGFRGLSDQRGTVGRDIGLDPGYVDRFRLSFGLRGWGAAD